jgi:hypothetical protein
MDSSTGERDQLLLIVASTLAAIRVRAARLLANAEEAVSIPPEPDEVVFATRATVRSGGDDVSSLCAAGAPPSSVDDTCTTLAACPVLKLELPALHEAAQSTLEQCAAHLRAGPGWRPLLVADRIDAAVREVCRAAALRNSPLCDEPSAELVSLAFAAIQLLANGEASTDDNGYATMVACRQIVEACARHPPTALVAFELSIDAAGSIVGALERSLMEGHTLMLDDACARAQLASAHIFDALEGVAALLRAGGERSLAELPPTRQLLHLEQRIRDSEPPFAQAYPLVAGSITQCAWVAIGGADDERMASRACTESG